MSPPLARRVSSKSNIGFYLHYHCYHCQNNLVCSRSEGNSANSIHSVSFGGTSDCNSILYVSERHIVRDTIGVVVEVHVAELRASISNPI